MVGYHVRRIRTFLKRRDRTIFLSNIFGKFLYGSFSELWNFLMIFDYYFFFFAETACIHSIITFANSVLTSLNA